MPPTESARIVQMMLAAVLSAVCFAVCLPSGAVADDMIAPLLLEGEEAEVEELGLWELIERERYVRAREEAEKYLLEHPSSYVAHLVLGMAQHYGEANFPKALFTKPAPSIFSRRPKAYSRRLVSPGDGTRGSWSP